MQWSIFKKAKRKNQNSSQKQKAIFKKEKITCIIQETKEHARDEWRKHCSKPYKTQADNRGNKKQGKNYWINEWMNECAIKVEDNQSWEPWTGLNYLTVKSDGHSESNWWT